MLYNDVSIYHPRFFNALFSTFSKNRARKNAYTKIVDSDKITLLNSYLHSYFGKYNLNIFNILLQFYYFSYNFVEEEKRLWDLCENANSRVTHSSYKNLKINALKKEKIIITGFTHGERCIKIAENDDYS